MRQSLVLLLMAVIAFPVHPAAASPLLQGGAGGMVITTEYAPGTQPIIDTFLATVVPSDWLVPEGSPARYEMHVISSTSEDRRCEYTLPGGVEVVYALNTMQIQLAITITDLETGEPLESRTFEGYSYNCPQTVTNRTGTDTVYGDLPPDEIASWLARVMALASDADVAVVLIGLSDLVRQVTYSPDGQTILTVDNTVRTWDAQTGQQQQGPRAGLGLVSSAAFSPDGSLIAAGNSNGAVTVWDAVTNETLYVFETASDDQWGDQVNAVAFHPDGTRIAAGGYNSRIEIWNLATGEKQLDLQGHSDNIVAIAFSPDGSAILTASDDGTVRIWDAATGEERLQFTGHEHQLWEAYYSPDGQHVLSHEWAGGVLVWEASTGDVLFQLDADNPFFSPELALYTPDGQAIVTVEMYPDKMITRWDAQTGERLGVQRSLEDVPETVVRSLSFSPDGQHLAVALGDLVAIWPMQ